MDLKKERIQHLGGGWYKVTLVYKPSVHTVDGMHVCVVLEWCRVTTRKHRERGGTAQKS